MMNNYTPAELINEYVQCAKLFDDSEQYPKIVECCNDLIEKTKDTKFFAKVTSDDYDDPLTEDDIQDVMVMLKGLTQFSADANKAVEEYSNAGGDAGVVQDLMNCITQIEILRLSINDNIASRGILSSCNSLYASKMLRSFVNGKAGQNDLGPVLVNEGVLAAQLATEGNAEPYQDWLVKYRPGLWSQMFVLIVADLPSNERYPETVNDAYEKALFEYRNSKFGDGMKIVESVLGSIGLSFHSPNTGLIEQLVEDILIVARNQQYIEVPSAVIDECYTPVCLAMGLDVNDETCVLDFQQACINHHDVVKDAILQILKHHLPDVAENDLLDVAEILVESFS